MKKKTKIRFRKPVPEKPSHPIGTKRGKKGYNRKHDRFNAEAEIINYYWEDDYDKKK